MMRSRQDGVLIVVVSNLGVAGWRNERSAKELVGKGPSGPGCRRCSRSGLPSFALLQGHSQQHFLRDGPVVVIVVRLSPVDGSE